MSDSGEFADLNLPALTPWLLDALPSVMAPFTAARIGGGQSNLTYRLTSADGHVSVLRRPPHGTLLASAHDVLREARFLKGLEKTPVPVPRIYASHHRPPGAHTPMVLMEFVDGHVLDSEPAALALSKNARERTGLALAEVLADLHEVEPESVGLADMARQRPYADRQLRRWTRQWDTSSHRKLGLFDEVTKLLGLTADASQATSILHGDLHVRNALLDRATGEIRTVLDWELSAVGEPLADLGTMLAYWQDGDRPPVPLFTETRSPGFVDHLDLVRAYEERRGVSVPPERLRFWHALALWKIAIILQGVIDRVADDPRNLASASASPIPADGVVSLLESARDVANGSSI